MLQVMQTNIPKSLHKSKLWVFPSPQNKEVFAIQATPCMQILQCIKYRTETQGNSHQNTAQTVPQLISSPDPFLGNFLKNLIRDSIQTELAAWQKPAPFPQLTSPPFLPGMSHFTQVPSQWNKGNLQQMDSSNQGPSQWSH